MALKIKIAYIGGGSKNWAHTFMSDLSLQKDLYGDIALYDIDIEAANRNKILGELINKKDNVLTKWNYYVTKTIDEALINSDVVIISILPGTFKEMDSDVHAPNKYGIYQTVGDTTGPGGIFRAMRTVPIYEGFAKKIKEICPNAWVVNLTNPMALCVKTLYDVFPEIKAFGCCHEVFNAQMFLTGALEEVLGIKRPDRRELECEITGVNHFTWMNTCYYQGEHRFQIDVFKVLEEFISRKFLEGYYEKGDKDKWMTDPFAYGNRVKMDLFNKYHILASAGDRHLVEFLDNEIYLKDLDTIKSWHIAITPVSLRIQKQEDKIKEIVDIVNGKRDFELKKSNEEAVELIKAVLGLGDVKSNVNLLNRGQVEFLPIGAVVETNALFSKDNVMPVKCSKIPTDVEKLIEVSAINNLNLYDGIKERNIKKIFEVFKNDPLCQHLSNEDSLSLFKEMMENTKEYLIPYYDNLEV